jgi:hypothetical protein
MFQLSEEEFETWRSQIVMSNPTAKIVRRAGLRGKIVQIRLSEFHSQGLKCREVSCNGSQDVPGPQECPLL